MYTDVYCTGLPEELFRLADTGEMRRLENVGMHCGCEYTAFPIYRTALPYSRYTHSLGAAAITWRFTASLRESAAALFHDIATPVFAHTVDFLHRDYLTQESTEAETGDILRRSREITEILDGLSLTVGEVEDYHIYPIADNPSPRLSSDRLEYTLGNARLALGMTDGEAADIIRDLFVGENETGERELCFAHLEEALALGKTAIFQSRWFVSDDDRFSMQALADVLRYALSLGVLTERELGTTEPEVIGKLLSHPETAALWRRYRSVGKTCAAPEKPEGIYAVKLGAKKRYIDPLVRTERGARRLTEVSGDYAEQVREFLKDDFDRWVWAAPQPSPGSSASW